MMEKECRSGLRLDYLYFKDIKCSRKSRIEKTELNINYKINQQVKNDVAKVEIVTEIVAQDNSINVQVTTFGQFTLVDGNNEYDENTKKDMLRLSTVAIMMPYIRSQVSIITTQPDLTPILLQPVDVTLLMAQQA